jgi:hypothetical protein
MRGFVLVVCSVLLAIGIGVAALAAGSSPLVDSGAESFAQRVLAEAPIPPSAHIESKLTSMWLDAALATPGLEDLIDLHRLYRVDEAPDGVNSYLEGRLPRGAKVTSTATSAGPAGDASGFVVTLAVSGPHEYLAELEYDMAPLGTRDTALRVDSETVWLPGRLAAEMVRGTGAVEVTGFSQTSLKARSSGSVTVTLDRARAFALERTFDSLPLGPEVFCMENSLLYRIAFHLGSGSGNSFVVEGWGCAAEVDVTSNGKATQPLYDADCSLLRAVMRLFPPGEAEGTRTSVAGCRS